MVPKLEISNLCISCDNCRLICPENSILKSNHTYIIETWSCTLCQICIEICPVDCIHFTKDEEGVELT